MECALAYLLPKQMCLLVTRYLTDFKNVCPGSFIRFYIPRLKRDVVLYVQQRILSLSSWKTYCIRKYMGWVKSPYIFHNMMELWTNKCKVFWLTQYHVKSPKRCTLDYCMYNKDFMSYQYMLIVLVYIKWESKVLA